MIAPPILKKIFFFLIIQGIFTSVLIAQGAGKIQKKHQFAIPFLYDDDKAGEVIVYYTYKKKDGKRVYLLNTANTKIDFKGVEEGKLTMVFHQLKSTEKKKERKRFNADYQLVITKDCITLPTGTTIPNFSEIIAKQDIFKISESSSDRSINFIIGKALTSLPVVRFTVVDMNSDRSDWDCSGGVIGLGNDVVGVIGKPKIEKPPVKEEIAIPAVTQDWNVKRNRNIDSWVAHLNSFPNSPHKSEALGLIENHFKKKDADARSIGTIKAYRNLITHCEKYPDYSRFYKGFIKRANKKIAGYEKIKEDMQSPCYIEWNKIKNSTEYDDFKDYVDTYSKESVNSTCEGFIIDAKEKLVDLAPIDLTYEEVENGYTAIFIKNALNPRYKDISLDGNLKINTSRFKDENVLLVKFPVGGRYEVLVEDELGKQDSISFDNNLIARMRESADSTLIIVKFEKGSQPYRVNFINQAKDIVVFSEENINSQEWEISKQLLIDRDATGNLTIEASDDNLLKPLTIGSTFIPILEEESGSIFMLVVLATVAILLATAIFLFYIKKIKKNN